LSCEGTSGDFDGSYGWTTIRLESDYNQNNGDVTIRVTNTLNENTDNESIGYGDMHFEADYDPRVDWRPT